MGCDIHFFVERRVGDAWVSADKRGRGRWDREGETSVLAPFYDGRNYDLFAILADVRNGRGFAGIRTGDGFVPISAPRGVPVDASEEYRAAVEAVGPDGHSHSWLTLAEVLAYDWTQTSRKTGVVDLDGWAYFNESRDRGPDSWCDGVSGPGIRILSDDEFKAAWEAIIKSDPELKPGYSSAAFLRGPRDGNAKRQLRMIELLGGGRPYARVEWTTSYHRTASVFWSETIPRLLRVGAPDDVRCVFFFDN